jgi:hypothetical protein
VGTVWLSILWNGNKFGTIGQERLFPSAF